MVFTVRSAITDPGDATYYTPEFRGHVEAHLNLFRHTNPTPHQVTADNLYQFEGNLFGYLASVGISPDRHWLIMRMNEFHNPNEFGRVPLEYAKPVEGMTLLLPSDDLLSRLRTLFLNKQK